MERVEVSHQAAEIKSNYINASDMNTPTGPCRKIRVLGVLPDVVTKAEFVNPNNVSRRKQRCSFGTPVTVKSQNDIHEYQQVMENQTPLAFRSLIDDKTSPGLARLRMTPGRLKEKQQQLIDQHEEIRQKGDKLKSGGGVSLWPEMLQMRLTNLDVFVLVIAAVLLSVGTTLLLHNLHGETSQKLQKFTIKIQKFRSSHQISVNHTRQQIFQDQVVGWHKDLLQLTDDIQGHFDMSVMSTSYQLYIISYLMGLATLFYYLLDNMLSKNKLTPSRIKRWTLLLAVIGTWTVMMAYYLHLAYGLEQQAIACIQDFSSALAHLVVSTLNLEVYHAVLLYWRARFLDNASHGLLSVLGVLSVKDLVYYLQYYSVPIVTVIISPVLKVCCACFTVYGQGQYFKASS